MLCNDFEDRMDVLLDLRRRPEQDAALLAHSRICQHCEHLLATQHRLFAGLRQGKIPQASPRFTQNVLQSVAKPPSERRGRGLVRAVAIAASLLTVAIPTAWFARRSAATDARAMASAGPPAIHDPAVHDPAVHDSPVHDSPVQSNPESEPEPTRWERGAAEAGAPAAQHVAESPEPTGFPGFSGSFTGLGLGFANLRQRKQVDEIAGGLRPIADGFEAAIDALKSTVRSNKEPRRNKPQAEIHRGVWSRSLA